jgi:hypothetical protein
MLRLNNININVNNDGGSCGAIDHRSNLDSQNIPEFSRQHREPLFGTDSGGMRP